MRYYPSINHFKLSKPHILTIGVFDGVHLGHQFLLKQLTTLAKNHNWQSTVLTFDQHPTNVLNPNQPVKLIFDLESKIRLLQAQNIDNLIVQPFTQNFANLTATEFVSQILVHKLQISAILITPNFRFGKNKQGDARMLTTLAKNFSFQVFSAKMYSYQDQIVSSSLIRQLLADGRQLEAKCLLGHQQNHNQKDNLKCLTKSVRNN
jgi:riboflavin kinase/FMN adenylyltransferase